MKSEGATTLSANQDSSTPGAPGSDQTSGITGQQSFLTDAGQIRKELGLATAGANASGWDRSVWRNALIALAAWSYQTRQAVQLYDAVLLFGIPEPDDYHRLGAFMSNLAKAGYFTRGQAVPSKRPTSGKSLLWSWHGTAKAAREMDGGAAA